MSTAIDLYSAAGDRSMSQVTFYLDKDTQTLVERVARASGMSKNRWVAEIIRKYAAEEWPDECLKLAGRFALPLREDSPTTQSPNVPHMDQTWHET